MTSASKQSLPRGVEPDELLTESAVTSRLKCRIADLRLARFHRTSPPFVRVEGKFQYPARALEQWLYRASCRPGTTNVTANVPIFGLNGDFSPLSSLRPARRCRRK